MKKSEEKFFWFNNLVIPFIIGIYFYNEFKDNWIGIAIPIYCVIYWLCAISYLGYKHK